MTTDVRGHVAEFDAAIGRVTQERGSIYGHPLVNFRRMAAAEEVLAECTNVEMREILRSIWFKLCRLVQSPDHLDSLIDVAGYARCGCMIVDAQRAGRVDQSKPAKEQDASPPGALSDLYRRAPAEMERLRRAVEQQKGGKPEGFTDVGWEKLRALSAVMPITSETKVYFDGLLAPSEENVPASLQLTGADKCSPNVLDHENQGDNMKRRDRAESVYYDGHEPDCPFPHGSPVCTCQSTRP